VVGRRAAAVLPHVEDQTVPAGAGRVELFLELVEALEVHPLDQVDDDGEGVQVGGLRGHVDILPADRIPVAVAEALVVVPGLAVDRRRERQLLRVG